jgi:hypothetical protein
MLPSSKTKASIATRRIPPAADASRAQVGAQAPATRESAQRSRVWLEDRRQQIAAKAYELWEQRGCRHGHDLEDWFDAEAIVIQSLPASPK